MNKKTFTTKSNGDTLNASEWNELTSYTNTIVDAVNNIGEGGSDNSLPNIYINEKGNFNIETSAEIGNTSKGKINIESMDDIQLKPGDDIILYSHHRAEGSQDEVSVKVTDGDDIPVKLQLNAAEITLTTKDKSNEKGNANVMDVTVNSKKGTRGYLKVRAKSIDLRCEDHGGIAIQPKGNDGEGNENKIKFEHGGGDGLEFGTFNTEKTSIWTNEYRFRKNGVIKLASRIAKASDKYDSSDDTTKYKYQKQEDDFYDVIRDNEASCTWADIVRFISWAKINKYGYFENYDPTKIEQDYMVLTEDIEKPGAEQFPDVSWNPEDGKFKPIEDTVIRP